MGTSTPLKDQQGLLDHLAEYAGSANATEEGLAHLSYSNGLMTAVAVGPQFIDPTEWLPLIVTSVKKRDEIDVMDLVAGFVLLEYDKMLEGFSADEKVYEPFFWEDGDNRVVTTDWAEGFLAGMRLRPNGWSSVVKADDRVLGTMLYVLLQEDEFFTSLAEMEVDPEEILATARKELPDVLFELYDRWAETRFTASNASIRRVQKIGRNEPCPCGSGKKYKKCCLN